MDWKFSGSKGRFAPFAAIASILVGVGATSGVHAQSLSVGEVVTVANYREPVTHAAAGLRVARAVPGADDTTVAEIQEYFAQDAVVIDANTAFILGRKMVPEEEYRLWKIDFSAEPPAVAIAADLTHVRALAVSQDGHLLMRDTAQDLIFEFDILTYGQTPIASGEEIADLSSVMTVGPDGAIYAFRCLGHVDYDAELVRIQPGSDPAAPQVDTLLTEEDGVACTDIATSPDGKLVFFAGETTPTDDHPYYLLVYGEYTLAPERNLVAFDTTTEAMSTVIDHSVLAATVGWPTQNGSSWQVEVDSAGVPLLKSFFDVFFFDPPTQPGVQIPVGPTPPDDTYRDTVTGFDVLRAACSDGRDNDGDGAADLDDPHCEGPLDTIEICAIGFGRRSGGLPSPLWMAVLALLWWRRLRR